MPSASRSTSRVFTIPDDEDDEDDDDYEDDSVVETTMPSTQGINAKRGPSIDLTHDEADEANEHSHASNTTSRANINSDVIDLTSEPCEPLSPKPFVESTQMNSAAASPTPPDTFSNTVGAYLLDSEANDFVEHLLNEHGNDNVYEDDLLSSQEDAHDYDEELNSDDIRMTDSEADSAMTGDSGDDMSASAGDIDDDDDVDVDDDDYNDDNDDNDSIYNNLHYQYIRSACYRRGRWPSMRLLAHTQTTNNDDSLGDEGSPINVASSSSVSMSDSGSSPVPTGLDSSLPSSPDPPISKELTSESVEKIKSAEAETSDKQNGPFATPYLFTAPEQTAPPTLNIREPSPSDAAMFKSRPVLDKAMSYSRAQALGEKSGKFEFFAARENNRAILPDSNSSLPVSAIRETLNESSSQHAFGTPADHLQHSPLLPLPLPAGVDSTSMKHSEEVFDGADTTPRPSPLLNPTTLDLSATNEAQSSAWSTSGEKFINNPHSVDLPAPHERPQSPEFDMSSAYAFQLSKMATEVNVGQNLRRVGIEDLLTQEPKGVQTKIPYIHLPPIDVPSPLADLVTLSTHGTKRSFEDAFIDGNEPAQQDQGHDDAIDGTNNSESADMQNDSIPKTPAREQFRGHEEGEVQPIPPSMAPVATQPSKRRRFAEAAACVALGGAAAFTFLVSTAPAL